MDAEDVAHVESAVDAAGLSRRADTVRRLLRQQGYVLRANRKRLNKKLDPDRDRQMRYVARKRRAFQKAGLPVISVDAKQRELIGNFKHPGQTWRQRALDVWESDYPTDAEGVAIPYGIYDVTRNTGFVVVDMAHQTPEFVEAALHCWWLKEGQKIYEDKNHVLIEAIEGAAMAIGAGCGNGVARPTSLA